MLRVAPPPPLPPRLRWPWRWPWLAVLIGWIGWASDRTPANPLDSWQVWRWDRNRGFPHPTVQAILQSHDGYLWLATATGLARFDGLRFTVFGVHNTPALTSDDCRALAETADGTLWIGTANGLLRRQHHRFTRFSTTDGLCWNRIRTLANARDGSVWIGTERGLSRFQAGQFETWDASRGLLHPDVYAVLEDPSGVLWVGTQGGLLNRQPGATTLDPSIQPPDAAGHRISGLYVDSQHRLWAVCGDLPDAHYGTICWRQNGQWSQAPYQQVWCPALRVTQLAEDDDGGVWMPHVGDGFYRFHHGLFHTRNMPGPSGRDWIHGFHADREGNLWAGTQLSGLLQYRRRAIELYSTPQGLPSPNTWSITQTRDDTVWIATDGGLCGLRADQLLTLTQKQGLSRDLVRALLEDPTGRLWIGTAGGLDSLEQQRLTRYRFPGEWFETKVRALHLGRDHRLWVAAARRLYAIDLRHVPLPSQNHPATLPYTGDFTNAPALILIPQHTFGPTNGLPSEDVRTVWEDQSGTLWVGTANAGLARYRSNRWDCLTTTNGLPSNRVWTLFEDPAGDLWIGTERGLVRHRQGQLTVYTDAQGLFDNTIHQILGDDTGHLWLASPRGLARVPLTSFEAVALGQATTLTTVTYNDSDGLPGLETNGQKNQPAACRSRDGRLWFPTPNGVVVFNPRRLPDNLAPPQVVIEEVRANGLLVYGDHPHPAAPSLPQPTQPALALPPGSAQVLEFRYTAPSLIAADEIRFEHRLQGVDRDWITADTRREAAYANLKPGSHRFEVQAVNKHGATSTRPTTLTVVIEPHFYQTLWFPTLIAGSVLGAVGTLYRWRSRYLQRIHQLERENALVHERARIAKDLHDGLGADLTQLTLLADLADASETRPQDLARHLRELSRTTRSTLTSLKEFLWATHPADATLEGLVSRICAHAEQYLAPGGIRCRFDLPPSLPSQPLSPELRHHVLLVAKEALANTARHAHATEVRIQAHVSPNEFTLVLTDNGRGFALPSSLPPTANPPRSDPAHPPAATKPATHALSPECHGLLTMRQRIEQVGGTFTLRSTPGHGTTVQIQLPLPARA